MVSSPSTGTNSTVSSSLQSSEEQKVSILDERKRKRMLSNRESARRSRMRKKKLVDDLMGQVMNLTAENHKILTNINYATRMCLDVESENSVLRAQVSELKHRLHALNDIVDFMSLNNHVSAASCFDHHHHHHHLSDECNDDFLMSPSWDLMMYGGNQQSMVMASTDVFMC